MSIQPSTSMEQLEVCYKEANEEVDFSFDVTVADGLDEQQILHLDLF